MTNSMSGRNNEQTGSRTGLLSTAITIICVLLGSATYGADPVFPLRISSNERHLEDQNGEPFLINGDTPWSLFVKLTKADVEQYLDDRRARGFNAIIANLIERGFGGPENRDGQRPFSSTSSLVGPNELYFEHADWVIKEATDRGFLIVLTPAYVGFGCGSEGWCQQMQNTSLSDLRAYGTFLGNRYADNDNVIWMNGGDADAQDFGALDEVGAIAQGIAAADPGKLMTAHCSRQNSAIVCYDETWLDINNTYSDCTSTASRSRDDYNRAPPKVFFYIEGQYEGEGASATCLRSQAYWSVLGGSTGHFFGNNPIWLFNSGWQQALDSTGARSMTHYAALFNSRPWNTLLPDYLNPVVLGDRGSISSASYVAAAVAADRSTAVVYSPERRALEFDLSRIGGSGARAWWFNPRSGQAELIGSFPNSGLQTFTPDGDGDWVLVVDNADRAFPAPGSSGNPTPKQPRPPANLTVE